MTNKPLRWGILGTGWIADLFVKDLQLIGRPVVACGSRQQASADAFAKTFKIPHAHGSYEALVADPEVDVIYVATPHPYHRDNAVMALNAGKHVLIEKPFTINARQAHEIISLAKAKKLVVLEAMWTRFLPHMRRMREILAAGTLGTVYSVIADHTRDLPSDPKHRLNDLALGGGALLDLHVYPMALAFDVLGTPTEIMAMARFKDTGADAEIATIFRHAEGGMSTAISTSDNGGPNIAMILGTKARIEFATPTYGPTSFRVIDREEKTIETFEAKVPGRGMQFQAEELERLVAEGKLGGEILPSEETIAIMETMDAIRAKIGLKYPGE